MLSILFFYNFVPSVRSVSFGNYFIAVSYEVSTQVIITLAWIVIYECTTLNSDCSRVSITLIQNIVVAIIMVVCLEESSFNYDVTTLAVNYRVSIAISIAANSECTTFDCNCCTIGCSNTDIIATGTTIECTASNCDVSISADCFYCNGIRILSDNTRIDCRFTSKCFASSDRFSVLSILIILIIKAIVFYCILRCIYCDGDSINRQILIFVTRRLLHMSLDCHWIRFFIS